MIDQLRSDLAFRLGNVKSVWETPSKIIHITNNPPIIIHNHSGGCSGGTIANN